jgi:hypothetical protein
VLSPSLALLAALLVGSGLTATSAAASTTLTFAPSADAHVRADRPNANFGSATKLQVDNSPVFHTLFKFTVTGIGTDAVSSAKLRLRAASNSGVGGYFFRTVSTSWNESTVNWSSAPATDPAPVASLGSVVSGTWYEVDLGSLVTGDGTFGLRVTSTSSKGAAYTSKEGAVGSRPQLVVVTASSSDTTPPTVSITEPSPGATVSGAVPVKADASDDVGVTSVDFSIDGAPQGSDATSPYGFTWDTTGVSNGSRTLTAVARDAAGNTTTSEPVTVVVDNAGDTTPPTAPDGLTATAQSATRVDLTWAASSDDVGVDHYQVVRDQTPVGTSLSTSYSDTTVDPSTTYTYVVIAYDAAGNPSPPSTSATVTTPGLPAGFSFAAAGDHGANTKTAASLAALDASGVSFYLALGDLDYGQTPTEAAWCDYVKARLPTLGPNFPFELVSGNHEEQGGTNGYIVNHAACLPDRMGSTPGPGSLYGAEYTFDYPAQSPLVRVIMISPNLTIENVAYSYTKGTTRYQWLAGVIDDARSSGIPWVVVGMHEVCLSAGRYGCDIGTDLLNLLVEKRVDLVLQGHDHNYQRGKQLRLDSATCPVVTVSYDADCVVDDGSDNVYPKGTGSVFVIDGVFGQTGYSVSEGDPQAPYFAKIDSSLTSGFTKYTVSTDRIDARFVNSTGGFTDAFAILAGATPTADRNAPTTPTNLQATTPSGTRVDLAWTPSTDDTGVDHYSVLRDGVWIGNSATATFADTTANPGATYVYAVRAYDAARNFSGLSESVTVTMPGTATTLTFTPIADTTLKADSPTSNSGSLGSIQIDNSPVKHGLLKFTVSGVPAGVARATLRLYAVDSSDIGGIFFRTGDTSWAENTVTWNTAPIADPSPTASLGRVVAGTWYEVDLTSIVTGNGTYSVRISSTSTNGADYASKEGLAGFAPQLVVMLTS